MKGWEGLRMTQKKLNEEAHAHIFMPALVFE